MPNVGSGHINFTGEGTVKNSRDFFDPDEFLSSDCPDEYAEGLQQGTIEARADWDNSFVNDILNQDELSIPDKYFIAQRLLSWQFVLFEINDLFASFENYLISA